MDRIRECAAQANITVALSFAENHHNSLYIAQSIIGSDGEVKMHRRKFKPTHMERTVFGDASGNCLKNVVDTAFGRVGALACWEHIQPLLKYHTYLQREDIHVAGWPPVFEHDGDKGLWSISRQGQHYLPTWQPQNILTRKFCSQADYFSELGTRTLSQTYAIESQTFVLHTTAVIGQGGIDIMKTNNGAMFNTCGGGSSAIYGPDGRQLSEDIPEQEEGIIYANLDLDDILRAKSFVDTCGHYSRPDLLFLGVDDREKLHRRTHDQV
jgi:nitrilase